MDKKAPMAAESALSTCAFASAQMYQRAARRSRTRKRGGHARVCDAKVEHRWGPQETPWRSYMFLWRLAAQSR